MRIAVTGGTGLVGGFVVRSARAAGHEVTVLSRSGRVPYRLGDAPDLSGVDTLVHAAFQHVPGRYRGGEGDDPRGFRAANLDGTLTLLEAARRAGVGRAVLLSSRAVYDGYAPGTALREEMAPWPDTAYGEVKAEAEAALASMTGDGFRTASLRATGVYGAARDGRHKWRDLFDDFRSGRPIAPRAGTEVHGDDLAAAILLLLDRPEEMNGRAWNVSDILLDRRDLLDRVARLTGWDGSLPDPADPTRISVMRTARLRGLGWRPGGFERLDATLPALLAEQGWKPPGAGL